MVRSSHVMYLAVIVFIFEADAFLSEWSLRAPCDDHYYQLSTSSERADDGALSCSVFLEKHYQETRPKTRYPLTILLACLAAAGLFTFREFAGTDRSASGEPARENDALPGLARRLRVRWWDEQPEFSPHNNWERCQSCHRLKRLQ